MSALKWTKKRPTKAGWYWWRPNVIEKGSIYPVVQFWSDGLLYSNVGGWFAGPIEPPTEEEQEP